MVERVTSELGRIDILVNNAGINIRKPPHALEIEEWDSVIHTNLTSAFLCSQAVYPAMKAAGGGKIINIGSMMSIFGASFAPAYAASKGGIVQFTRSCACAWAADNIQANAVLPGWIDTDLTKGARQQIDGLHDKVLARTPAARWGAIADFAGIAVFLSSAASDFVTGTAIPGRWRLFGYGIAFKSSAFSSEVDTGSREENASKQKPRAPFQFHRNGKGSSAGSFLSQTRCRRDRSTRPIPIWWQAAI